MSVCACVLMIFVQMAPPIYVHAHVYTVCTVCTVYTVGTVCAICHTNSSVLGGHT